ncbi:MAG: TraB/GumN family protein [Luteimonas sp.]|nr:TraB/GumN family protein [Luteimonas sp.]
MRFCLLAGLLMLLLPARAPAQQVPTASPPVDIADTAHADTPPGDMPIVDMDAVVVSGQQPGPGMWKVSKGDHVLYILGTLSPLPRRMQWIPDDVQKTIAQAQAVIDPPSVKVDSDIGLFRRMFLLPSLLKARRNPDGRTLQQVVAPDLYARWSVLKPRYIGNDAGIEKWRPIFAAQELYEAAMRKSGLSQKSVVQPVVEAAARKYRVPRISTLTTFMVKNPKAAIREFQATALADKDCFAKTMVRIETDLNGMRARANAWAVGDVAALRDLSHEDQYVACTRAITDSALAQKLGLGNVRGRVADTWLAAAEDALARNRVSFATLPISLLLRPDGFMARLRAKGYVIEEP